MATTPGTHEPMRDIREQIARVDRIRADMGRTLAGIGRMRRDVRSAPRMLAFKSFGAGALSAAGATFATLFSN